VRGAEPADQRFVHAVTGGGAVDWSRPVLEPVGPGRYSKPGTGARGAGSAGDALRVVDPDWVEAASDQPPRQSGQAQRKTPRVLLTTASRRVAPCACPSSTPQRGQGSRTTALGRALAARLRERAAAAREVLETTGTAGVCPPQGHTHLGQRGRLEQRVPGARPVHLQVTRTQRCASTLGSMADFYALRDRPSGRSRVRGPLLHAVPGTDRTRSALCGARVGGRPSPWAVRPVSTGEATTCPECSSLVDDQVARRIPVARSA